MVDGDPAVEAGALRSEAHLIRGSRETASPPRLRETEAPSFCSRPHEHEPGSIAACEMRAHDPP
jgi:hypothetical protein